jgi:FlaA1/EpsC-like NDP-sugar epimerase
MQQKFYIIGAGVMGFSIANDLKEQYGDHSVIAFLDDNPNKIGTKIANINILGPIITQLPLLDATASIIIAISSLSPLEIRQLYYKIASYHFRRILILPVLSQLIDPKGSFTLTREISPEDFLGRTPIVIDPTVSLLYLKNKRVLITGAGGSIGSELAKQLLIGGASRLFILGHGETSIYHTEQTLKNLQKHGIGIDAKIIPIIGELQDKDYIDFLINRLKVDAIFHCAAHKHVPLMESNPIEAIKNNIFGVHFITEAALKYNVKHFILISTDKAVDPFNIYGVTKAVGEAIVMNAHKQNPFFRVVRFGNVLGSRGSIIPLFQKQLQAGEPLTVTDIEMKRYFMTIPEACSLTLMAGGIDSSELLYLLDMGEPIKIIDLARQMLEAYDQPVNSNSIVITGLRPGEKITETLYSIHEKIFPTEYPKILKVETQQPIVDIPSLLDLLYPVCFLQNRNPSLFRNRKYARKILKQFYDSLEDLPNESEY